MIKAWKEMRAVGFREWCWFVLVLRRNESSPKLRLARYARKGMTKEAMLRLERDRARAHDLDIALRDLSARSDR